VFKIDSIFKLESLGHHHPDKIFEADLAILVLVRLLKQELEMVVRHLFPIGLQGLLELHLTDSFFVVVGAKGFEGLD